jgi:hypothetical protein
LLDFTLPNVTLLIAILLNVAATFAGHKKEQLEPRKKVLKVKVVKEKQFLRDQLFGAQLSVMIRECSENAKVLI